MALSILADMTPIVDTTIEKLRIKKFKYDPIVHKPFSRIASLVGSAQKRHGSIIEKSIEVALSKQHRSKRYYITR
jgi:hypothetical protein